MRVLVCGGRDYDNREVLYSALDNLHVKHPFSVLIHGDAKGADTLGADWAARNKVLIEVYPANWKRDGIAAGPVRNQQMLSEGKPDLVVAFPTPSSRGTWDMVSRARKAGVEIRLHGNTREH